MRIFLAVAMLSFAMPSLLADEAKPPFNILVVTSGHGADLPNFHRMFDELPNVRYDRAVLPGDMDLLAPGLEEKYDLVLTYCLNNHPITDAQRERFAALIESGMPLIVLHHSLVGYADWSLYREMVGGQYLLEDTEIDGKLHPASSYKYDLDIDVQVVDREHPITRGIENFTIHDEGYLNMYVREGVHVLLKTDHPDSTPELAWTTRYGKGPVFVLTLGHDNHAFENPNFRQILRQGIQWGIEESRKYNILILTGGHGFDQPNFYKMFDEMPNVRYSKATVPRDMDLLAPGLEKQYDLLFTYDMNNFPAITDAQRERFAALIESGMPLIVMHHSLCGHSNWQQYREMIGGGYVRWATEIDGRAYPASSYKYDLEMNIQVMDREHPITRGIEDFTIIDEGYKDMYIREGIHLLLKTDHPDATPEVAWTTKYGKGIIFAIALGHDNKAYENPNLRRILHQAIQWCIGESRKGE